MPPELRGGSAGIDSREPQRLCRIDVPDARDDPLVQKRELDADPPLRQRAAKVFGVELAADGVRTENCTKRGARTQQLDGCERTWIGEYNTRSALELENEPRKPGKLGARRTDRPIASHAKVHVQRGAVVQDNQLVLSTTIDARDATPGQATQARHAEMTSNVGMKDLRASDALA